MTVRNIKLLAASAVAASSFLTSAAYAAYPAIEEPVAVDHSGFYVGAEVGWGQQRIDGGYRYEPVELSSTGTVLNSGTANNLVRVGDNNKSSVAGRINIGYNFNEYFAVEVGGAAWSQANADWSVYNSSGNTLLATGHGHLNSYDVDLLGKVTYPFSNGFKVFAKAGGAYVWSTRDLNSRLNTWAPIIRHRADETDSRLRPEAAAGIGYNIDDNWSVSAQYSYIWGNSNNFLRSDNAIPNLQMATVGVQYDIT